MEDSRRNANMEAGSLDDEALEGVAGGAIYWKYTMGICQRCRKAVPCGSKEAAHKFTYCDQCKAEMALEQQP